jgi:hypothetical protein
MQVNEVLQKFTEKLKFEPYIIYSGVPSIHTSLIYVTRELKKVL